jgi:hypothetical protein
MVCSGGTRLMLPVSSCLRGFVSNVNTSSASTHDLQLCVGLDRIVYIHCI